MADEVRVAIAADADLVTARAEARAMAERLGFPRPDPTLIATAISEVARNIVVHVGRGEIVLEPFEDADRYGLVVIATRRGAGDPRRRGGAPRRLQRQGRPRPRAARSAAADGRLRDRLGRRHGHDGDDEEVAVPRRARAPARGAPSAWLSAAVREPVEWGGGHAVPARARRRSGDLAVVARLPEGVLVAGDRRPRARRRGRPRRPRGRRGRPRERPSADLVSCWSSAATPRCEGTRGAAISLAFVSPLRARDDLARGRQRRGSRARAATRRRPARRARSRCASGVPGHELPPVRPATLAIGRATCSCWPPTGSTRLRRRARRLRLGPRTISERILARHWKPPDDALVVAVRYLGPRP